MCVRAGTRIWVARKRERFAPRRSNEWRGRGTSQAWAGASVGWLLGWLGDKGGTGLVSEGPPLQQLAPLHVFALHLEQHVQRLGLHPRTGSRPVT